MHPRLLLTSGFAAGILLPVVIWTDGATRSGYSLWHHGASQLGTGDRAWLQVVNFVVGGLLLMAFAAGVRRTLRPGRGSRWAAILIAAAGAAFVVAGLIPTDPALGYPPGQPADITLAGRVHGLVGLVLFGALSAVAFVLARSGGNADRGWAIYSRITGVLVIALAFAAGIAYRLDLQGIWQPAPAGLFEHASLLTAFCWIIALATRLRSSRQVATVVAENAERRE